MAGEANRAGSLLIEWPSEEGDLLWVFREGTQSRPCRELLQELRTAVERARACPGNGDAALDALIRAGQLESAAADAGSSSAEGLSSATDAISAFWMSPGGGLLDPPQMGLAELNLPETLTVSKPEGFAYYALHPKDFRCAAEEVASPRRHHAVVGIRSIGSTLSSVVASAIRGCGGMAERITVRPEGHPFDRHLEFTPSQRAWVQKMNQPGTQYLIADEGPGMSGSSFLSVGKALVGAGVAASSITFMGSREPEIDNLCSPGAARRWGSFQWRHAVSRAYAHRAGEYAGGGAWRKRLLNGQEWPAIWTQMESLKFIARDEKQFLKFDGLGHFGAQVRERATRLAEGGLGCTPRDGGDGMSCYPLIEGRCLRREDLREAVLESVARSCAFRAGELRTSEPSTDLREMLLANLEKLQIPANSAVGKGIDLESLFASEAVITDGRMQPHEWRLQPDGFLVKTDGATHGDGHFFPGPTDIAWDLAGAIVEWAMERDASDWLVSSYMRLTGDDPRRRLPAFLLAYRVFRLGYCELAAGAEAGSEEEPRLRRASEFYREQIERQLLLPCLGSRS